MEKKKEKKRDQDPSLRIRDLEKRQTKISSMFVLANHVLTKRFSDINDAFHQSEENEIEKISLLQAPVKKKQSVSELTVLPLVHYLKSSIFRIRSNPSQKPHRIVSMSTFLSLQQSPVKIQHPAAVGFPAALVSFPPTLSSLSLLSTFQVNAVFPEIPDIPMQSLKSMVALASKNLFYDDEYSGSNKLGTSQAVLQPKTGLVYAIDLHTFIIVVINPDMTVHRIIHTLQRKSSLSVLNTPLAFSNDGKKLFVVDNARQCIDSLTEDGQYITSLNFSKFKMNHVNALAVDECENIYIASHYDSEIRVLDQEGYRIDTISPDENHISRGIWDLLFLPNRRLVVCCNDGNVFLFNDRARKQRDNIPGNFFRSLRSNKKHLFRGPGNTLYLRLDSNAIFQYDLDTQKWLACIDMPSLTWIVTLLDGSLMQFSSHTDSLCLMGLPNSA
eukprot:TRINITY_DN8644_c0_g1_i3.p1 TRINITY_DN8644_c0_g1~~TRINITY_DN8644_c0_g1_i3.p1  ORF type:complete len:443 (+),score=74.29 TRINITY_DN8644_c0_g1_i3:45-1373(+)